MIRWLKVEDKPSDLSVADPGFPRRGNANFQGGAQTYYLNKFSPKTA